MITDQCEYAVHELNESNPSDGHRGILQYRQYNIGHLFTHHDYEDVVYLLIWGSLPTLDARMTLRRKIANCMVPSQSITNVVQSFK